MPRRLIPRLGVGQHNVAHFIVPLEHPDRPLKERLPECCIDNIRRIVAEHFGQSTINGNRSAGILNNALYVGQLVWNRQRFIKDPATGKRVTRLNPEEEWVRTDVPELRIIDVGLWEAAKARQKALDKKPAGLWQRKRPKYLLSGLLRYGSCGGYSKINADD